MSETVSQLPTTAGVPALSDVLPITRGYTGTLTGTTYADTVAKALSSNHLIYASDPRYGVVADGATDDTTAWGAALTAAFNLGTWVVAPIGSVSVVSALTIPTGVGILGRSTTSWTALGPATLGSVIKCTSASTPGITLNAFSQLQDIQVQGNASQPCVSVSAGYAELVNVTAFGGSVGISGTLTAGSNRIYRCRVHDCATAGILAGLGLSITDPLITACGNGIQVPFGAHGVSVRGGRITKCIGYGLSADGTTGTLQDLIVSGVEFDANNKASVMLRDIISSTVSGGNVFARSGQGQASTVGSPDDAHIYLQNCTGVVVVGNASRTGLNDSGGGYNSPFYAIYDGSGNTSSIIGQNALAYHNNAIAPTSGPINITSTFNLASGLNQSYWS
jgi:hypothetical protein